MFVEQVGDLTREVATDLYLRRYADLGESADDLPGGGEGSPSRRWRPGTPGWCPHAGQRRVRRPTGARPSGWRTPRPPGRRSAGRLQSGRLFTYDDMLTRLRDALADPDRGPAAAARLRERYRVVMVDEFQDTDPVQWEILRRAFVGFRTLILIGDPKQAIYAFRGADVYSYLDAVAAADARRRPWRTNWRSDAALVDGPGPGDGRGRARRAGDRGPPGPGRPAWIGGCRSASADASRRLRCGSG